MPKHSFHLPLFLAIVSLATLAACSDDTTDEHPRKPQHKDAAGDDELDGGTADAASTGSTRDAARSDAPSVQRWVGSVDNTDVRLGAVIESKSRARLFFCGGPTSYQSATRWIILDVAAAGGFEFDDSGWIVRGKLDGDQLSGTIDQGGENHAFSATPVAEQTIAGLYEGSAECGRVGLIVTQRDSKATPSGQGACLGGDQPPEQVNPILPIALKDGSIRVKVGNVESSVHEAAPAPR